MTAPVAAPRTGRSPGGSSHRGGHRDRRRAVLGRVTLVVSVTAGDPACGRPVRAAAARTVSPERARSPTPLAPALTAAGPVGACDTSARDLSHACAGRTGLCDRCDTSAAPPRRRRSGRGDVSQPGICRICRTARTGPCDTSPGPLPRPCGRGPPVTRRRSVTTVTRVIAAGQRAAAAPTTCHTRDRERVTGDGFCDTSSSPEMTDFQA